MKGTVFCPAIRKLPTTFFQTVSNNSKTNATNSNGKIHDLNAQRANPPKSNALTYIYQKSFLYSLTRRPRRLCVDMTSIRPSQCTRRHSARGKRECYGAICDLIDLVKFDQFDEWQMFIAVVRRRHNMTTTIRSGTPKTKAVLREQDRKPSNLKRATSPFGGRDV